MGIVLVYIAANQSIATEPPDCGFETDLGLKGQEFATLLSILYVGYMIMQVPS